MQEISGIAGSSPASIGRAEPQIRGTRAPEVAVRRDSDRVEVSREAREASRSGEIRRDLVERVRDQIDAGTYDNEERTNLAADALLLKLRAREG